MEPLGKMLVIMGAALLILGGAIWLLARMGFRGLPGDIHYQSSHVSFYFPIVTCIVLSVLATLALWIWQWMSRR